VSAARAHAARLAGVLPRRRPAAVGRGLGRLPPRGVALAVVLGLLLGGAWLWLRDSSLVRVKQVAVTGAAGPEAKAIVAALERAGRDMTTLHVRRSALRSAVARFPLVHDVEADAKPPHRLAVHVILERPVALLAGAGRRQAVTAAGKVLPRSNGLGALAVVPVRAEAVGGEAKGVRTLGALAALGAAPPVLRARVKTMRWTTAHGLTATLRDGPDLYLGAAARLEAKWLAIARVLADTTAGGARYVDARVPERPAAGGVAPSEAEGAQTPDNAAASPSPSGATASGSTPSATPVAPSATPPATGATPTATTPSTPVTPSTVPGTRP
jgi:cell division protein FtsQ